MNDQWGTREHQADRHQPTRTRRETVPGTANAQQAYGALTTIALTTAALLCYFDRLGAIDVGRGVYAILAALAAIGGHGWSVCRAETRVRRDLGGKVAELTIVLTELRDEVARQGIARVSPADRRQGVCYVGRTPRDDIADTLPQMPAVGPEAEAALRRINMRLLNGGGEDN